MKKIPINHSSYQIQKARIINAKQMTEEEKLFELVLENGEPLDHEPGQFVQVSLFGVGEAPISVCSSPTNRNSFELCIRAVGRFTDKIHNLDKGDEIGIRGPFGNGLPTVLLEGNDLLLVAGGLGIAPMRSLINYVIDNRRDFGNVNILLGCKTPDSMLFGNEIEHWEKRLDINFACTVDRSDPDWKGNVGLITSLIPGVDIDPQYTYSVVIGPPVMYRFVIEELLKKGIEEKKILMSLERHMKCGLGHCGHCQINDIYCCQDGPVFTYEKVKTIEGAI